MEGGFNLNNNYDSDCHKKKWKSYVTALKRNKLVSVLQLKHEVNVVERLLEARTESVKKTLSEQMV